MASTLDYVDQSKGSAYCTLVAGDDRDGASAHRASLSLMVTHRYARAGVVEIRCVGTPDTIVASEHHHRGSRRQAHQAGGLTD